MDRTPRIAALQDISGFGRCSMTVVLPVLSAMGGQCCPMPTAYLSAHTGFPPTAHSAFLDMTGQMKSTALHWKELGVTFDAIYSGFVGSEAQLCLIEQFIETFHREGTLVMVDPVMGDNGQIYRTYTPAMCRRMGELAARAGVITPNLTEAAILLGEDCTRPPETESELREWMRRLSMRGQRSVVLTGVGFVPGQVGAACFDRETGAIRFAMADREPGSFPGTGDLFAAVLLGDLLRGQSLEHGVEMAVKFVRNCVHYTLSQGTPILEGVQFEPLLGELTARD